MSEEERYIKHLEFAKREGERVAKSIEDTTKHMSKEGSIHYTDQTRIKFQRCRELTVKRVNQISSSSKHKLVDVILKDLSKVKNKLANPVAPSDPLELTEPADVSTYLYQLLKAFVTDGLDRVAAQPIQAWQLAYFAVQVSKVFPSFMENAIAYLYKHMPIVIPYLPIPLGKDLENARKTFKIQIGYKVDYTKQPPVMQADEEFVTQAKAAAKFLSAMLITKSTFEYEKTEKYFLHPAVAMFKTVVSGDERFKTPEKLYTGVDVALEWMNYCLSAFSNEEIAKNISSLPLRDNLRAVIAAAFLDNCRYHSQQYLPKESAELAKKILEEYIPNARKLGVSEGNLLLLTELAKRWGQHPLPEGYKLDPGDGQFDS